MDELRLLHFADLHLGVETMGRPNPSSGLNQRVHDVCDRLDEVCETVEREAVHAVIFAGDAFMNPRPSPTLQKLLAERIRRLVNGGAAVFLLVGNHDLPKMAGIAHPHSIYPALEVEGVVVGERAEIYRLPLRDDAAAPVLQIAALPHFSRAEVVAQLHPDEDAQRFIDERVAERVGTLGERVDPSLPAVFAGHCHVNQAEIGEQTLFGVSDIEVSLSTLVSGQPFPYYALGHVHKRQVLQDDPFVAYCGSLERVDFGEGERVTVPAVGRIEVRDAEPKGFLRANLVEEGGLWRLAEPPEFRAVRARRFVTVRVGELDAADPVGEAHERLERARAEGIKFENACVRVSGVVASTERSRISLTDLRARIPEAYDVRLRLESREPAFVRDPRFATRMTELQALESYLDSHPEWEQDREELLRLGRQLISEVLG